MGDDKKEEKKKKEQREIFISWTNNLMIHLLPNT